MVQFPVGYLFITNVSPELWQASVFNHPQVIGRLPDCDIVIPATYLHVSRRHALVGANKVSLWMKDLGSLGGTQLNGVPLLPNLETRMMIGDRISLAGLEIYVVSPKASVFNDDHTAPSHDEQSPEPGTIQVMGRETTKPEGDAHLSGLTAAETEIVRWICRGLTTSKEIGRQLFRSPNTIRTQLGSIFKKLDIHSCEQLLSFVREHEIAWTQPETNDYGNRQSSPTERNSSRETAWSMKTVDLDESDTN